MSLIFRNPAVSKIFELEETSPDSKKILEKFELTTPIFQIKENKKDSDSFGN